MPLVIKCPHCQKPAQIADQHAGQAVRCPSCKQAFVAKAAPARQPVAEKVGQNVGQNVAQNVAQQVAQNVARAVHAGGSKSPGSEPTVGIRPQAGTGTPRAATTSSAAPGPTIAAAPGPTQASSCPACQAPLLAGATVCLDCGWVRIDTELAGDSEVQPVLCVNPACGVANPPGERYCQRCNTALPAAVGTVLHGRYRLERLLAMGGFGAVYLAADLKANRPVAIKDMICADPQEFNIRLSFFQREAEILRALERVPIVPRVYDFIQQGQTAHLVMEYIRGQDLLKTMEARNHAPFPLDQVIEWGKSICEVLHLMHSQTPPVVHRDLKPDNLMLLEDGRTIKMIDFGTARDVGRSHKTRLQAKTRVYTEGYAPPEQIVGKPEARSDLFALAGTLYHLAAGKPPEGFYTARELETQLKEPSASPSGSVVAQSPEQRWFYELIKINLSEDANDRYFSAREFKQDLEQRRVTREVRCPACQQANPVRAPYCSRCAQPLTDATPPCNHCGKSNRLGSRFCTYCGNRLR